MIGVLNIKIYFRETILPYGLFCGKCSKILSVFIEPFFNGSNPSLNAIKNCLLNSIRIIKVCIELRN